MPADGHRNWSGNVRFHADEIHEPRSLQQLQRIVARAKHVRALGSGHSFSPVADIRGGDLVSLQHFKRIDVESRLRTVRIGAGVTFAELCVALKPYRLALHNLLSLLTVTVAGAVATASHGSGDANKMIAASVVGIEFVAADGSIVTVTKESDNFAGMVVALGGLGIIASLTLNLVPAFNIEQRVFLNVPMQSVMDRFNSLIASAYSVSLFTDFAGAFQCWLKSLHGESPFRTPSALSKATPADRQVHMLSQMDPRNCTPQLGLPGGWDERLSHFHAKALPSAKRELQSEFFVDRKHAVAALQELYKLGPRIAPLLMISEIRSIGGPDGLWMSPCYSHSSVGFHFTWKYEPRNVMRLLPDIEAALKPFSPRAHFGKICTREFLRGMRNRIAKLDDFCKLLANMGGKKFQNHYLRDLVS